MDYKLPIDNQLLLFAENEYGKTHEMVSPEFHQYATSIMENFNIQKPNTVDKALELYFILIDSNYE